MSSKKLFTVILDGIDVQEGYDLSDVEEVVTENFYGILTKGGMIDEMDSIKLLDIGETYVYHNEHKGIDALIIKRTN